MAGIYLHIPFCRKACHYCDFHFSTSLDYADRMVAAIVRDIEMQSAEWKEESFDSVYFGGGTPSVLSESQLQSILGAIQKCFVVNQAAEITFEVNPDDVDSSRITMWKSAGINRLSVGIQSFKEDLLQNMNRSHTAIQAKLALQLARDGGIENLSADLIYGQPSQDMVSWEEDVREMIDQDPTHISAYCLTVESGTALDHFVRKGQVSIPEDELIESQYNLLCSLLRDAGYLHYEVSNWGKPGYESRHNSAYWKREPYVGVGPSAHGFRARSRYWNVSNNAQYMKALEGGEAAITKEELSFRDAFNEGLMTSLRTADGLDLSVLQEVSEADRYSMMEHITKWEASGWGRLSNARFRLTESGMLHADRLASDLFILES